MNESALAAVLRRAASKGWTVAASGPSMLPRIPPGSILHVTGDRARPRMGEVWVFVNRKEAIVAHRFVRRTRDGDLQFFGDATGRPDEPVPSDRLVGRVHAVEIEGVCTKLRRRHAVGPLRRAWSYVIRRRARRIRARSTRRRR